MSICDIKIANDISSSCTDPLYTGKAKKGYIINKADIASFTESGHIISALTLAASTYAYLVEVNSKTPFQGTATAMNEGDMKNDFTNTVTFHIANDGAGFRKDVVEPIANGKFIIIVENEWGGTSGDNKFAVYGWQKGLVASGDNTEDADNGGWTFTLVEEGVPVAGYYFYDTDVATTRAALEALLAP